MTRPNKRKAGEIDYEDPMSFVADYCRRHGVTQDPGNSDIEKSCAARAMDAREEYKEKRDAAAAANSPNNGSAPGEDRSDRKGLSPAQKYTIRLQNNRKSANASKVYNEVFKRELSHCLQKLSGSPDKQCQSCAQLQSLHTTKSNEYFQEIDELREHVDQLQRAAQERDEELRKRQTVIEQLRSSLDQAQERAQNGTETKQISGAERDSDDTDEPSEEVFVSDSGVRNMVRQNDGYYNGRTPIRASDSRSHVSQLLLAGRMSGSPTPSEPDASHNITGDKKDAAMRPVDNAHDDLKEEVITCGIKATAEVEDKVIQTPYSIASASPGSFKQRLASSGILSFLPESESQGKAFHSGLTQSQNDDTDDKAQLLRNMPCSGGIPVGFLESQPSQPLLPPMKSSLGSEDLPLGGDSDLFMASQGSSGTPNKRMEAP